MSLEKLSNFLPITETNFRSMGTALTSAGGSKSPSRNLSNTIMPVTLDLIRQDLDNWRNADREAIDAHFPYRTKMQKMFRDTARNEHVGACIERRRDLTVLRKFEIQDANGKRDKLWTEYFEKQWFKQRVLVYIVDAIFYGYNLISIGDLVNGIPKKPTVVKRWNVSPDREIVTPIENTSVGYSWNDEPYSDWHIFVETVNDDGTTSCGMGALYTIAKTELYLRNNLGFNTDYIEMFAQPYRVLKTAKTEGPERDAAEASLREMGSAGYVVLDLMDELDFLEGGKAGNGYKSYNDIEHRLEAKVSKYLLGHADAIDSVPAKIGSAQLQSTGSPNSNHLAGSPVAKALRDKQAKDGEFVEPVVNEQVIPKLRNLGVNIPYGHKFVFLNDFEELAIRDEKNNAIQTVATTAMTFAQAKVKLSPRYLSEATGIPEEDFSEIEDEETEIPNPLKEPADQIKSGKKFKERSKNRPGKQ